jgi:hypothetical protein
MGLKTLRRPYDSYKKLNKRSGQLNLEKLDKAFDSILKGYDKDKLQDWIDGKV